MKTIDHSPLKILVTGGAGFIGANFIHYWLNRYPKDMLINLDALTYAGNRESVKALESQSNYRFVEGRIENKQLVNQLLADADQVVHFAAESHVDRSILNPDAFVQTNVLGTHVLLQASVANKIKHFHHVSTDEVFGSLKLGDSAQFNELTPYDPRSPYSATKAASDHLVRAYGETYGLSYTITNCSNNYGEYQFPEKLIPLVITNLLEGNPVAVYDRGQQIRDWLYVQDHCRAIELVVLAQPKHQTYLVGGQTHDVTNLELVKMILKLMNKSEELIEFVKDRPGHDQRYSVDWSLINQELGWKPSVDLEQGLVKTIDWYLTNQSWWKPLKEANKQYFETQYGK